MRFGEALELGQRRKGRGHRVGSGCAAVEAPGPIRELDVELLILDELEQSGEVPGPAIERLRISIAEERERLSSEVRDRIDDFDLEKVRKRAVAVARECEHAKHSRDPKRT